MSYGEFTNSFELHGRPRFAGPRRSADAAFPAPVNFRLEMRQANYEACAME